MGASVSNKFLKSDKFLRSDREQVKNGVTVLGYTCHDVAKSDVICGDQLCRSLYPSKPPAVPTQSKTIVSHR